MEKHKEAHVIPPFLNPEPEQFQVQTKTISDETIKLNRTKVANNSLPVLVMY